MFVAVPKLPVRSKYRSKFAIWAALHEGKRDGTAAKRSRFAKAVTVESTAKQDGSNNHTAGHTSINHGLLEADSVSCKVCTESVRCTIIQQHEHEQGVGNNKATCTGGAGAEEVTSVN